MVDGMASAGIYRIGIGGGIKVALGIIVIRRVIGGVRVVVRIGGSIIGVIVTAARIGGARGQGENQAKQQPVNVPYPRKLNPFPGPGAGGPPGGPGPPAVHKFSHDGACLPGKQNQPFWVKVKAWKNICKAREVIRTGGRSRHKKKGRPKSAT
jgi:hypothetical protein